MNSVRKADQTLERTFTILSHCKPIQFDFIVREIMPLRDFVALYQGVHKLFESHFGFDQVMVLFWDPKREQLYQINQQTI